MTSTEFILGEDSLHRGWCGHWRLVLRGLYNFAWQAIFVVIVVIQLVYLGFFFSRRVEEGPLSDIPQPPATVTLGRLIEAGSKKLVCSSAERSRFLLLIAY